MGGLQVSSDTDQPSIAKLRLDIKGHAHEMESIGNGPIDASFRAVGKLLERDFSLELYSVKAITSGTDAQGEVSVRLKENGYVVNGHGTDTDIVIASVKAYINAVNRLETSRHIPVREGSMI